MENFSLFDVVPDEEPTKKPAAGKLDVVKMNFARAEQLSWQELFSGFDELHAITFSSGIGFVCQLLEKFKKAEIIFGCDEVLSYSLQEVMAFQYQLVDRLRETAGKQKLGLVERIQDNTLRLFVARNVLSHEKIYLLSANDGRKRVIMGSANMSFAAFGGKQRENISYMDGEEAYDWYIGRYMSLRTNSTDQIAKEAILVEDAGENLEEIPIAHTVRTQKALVFQPAQEQKEEVRFALDVKNLACKFATAVPRPDKNGKLLLSPNHFKVMRQQVAADQVKEKELQKQYPQLEVLPDEKIVRMNGENLDLHPAKSDVKNDVSLFLEYMEGYKIFHGDVSKMQRRYFEFANWFFCSPFMAYMP